MTYMIDARLEQGAPALTLNLDSAVDRYEVSLCY